MKKREATELFQQIGEPIFKDLGWKPDFTKERIRFIKETSIGFDRVDIFFENRHLYMEPLASFGKYIPDVEDIMWKYYNLIPNEISSGLKRKENTIMVRKDEDDLQDRLPEGILWEEDVNKSLHAIIAHLKAVVEPILQECDSIQNLDNRINGVGENFWEYDHGKPFHFWGHFFARRVIIAKLAKGDKFEAFFNKLIDGFKAEMAAEGKVFDDRNIEITTLLDLLNEVS